MQIKISFKFIKKSGDIVAISHKTYLKMLANDFKYIAENDTITLDLVVLKPNEEMTFIIRETTCKEKEYYLGDEKWLAKQNLLNQFQAGL